MKANITLFNAETMVISCVKSIQKVCPDVVVHDFGSEDSGPDLVESIGVPLIKHGRLDGHDYVHAKEEISKQSGKVFWVDADEVYPESSINNVFSAIEEKSLVIGFWRNLKIKNRVVYISDYIHRGAVAWDSDVFELHREWPREKLRCRDGSKRRRRDEHLPEPEDIFCWHGVLLNISSLPDKKNRWKKRSERDDQSADLEWNILGDLPFKYKDPRILDAPKFIWYK